MPNWYSPFALQPASVEAECTPSSESGWHQAPSQEPHSAWRHQGTVTDCVCEHLCFISVYSEHPLARCIPMYKESLQEVIFSICESSKIALYK